METTNKRPRLLSLKEAAALIDGLAPYRLRMLCINNEIEHRKFGNKYMITDKALYKFFGLTE